jgi:hypothetical protein
MREDAAAHNVSRLSSSRPPAVFHQAEFRYGAVFVLTLIVVVFLIVAPATDWAHAVAFALESTALVVVVATSRTRADLRRVRSVAGALAAVAWVVVVASGVLPAWLMLATGGIVSIAIPLALVGGLVRLVRTHGVTLQAVAGSLSIYLLIALAFAWAIAFLDRVDPGSYNGAVGDGGTWVYFSFTVLTTTGFGDVTAATPVGRALAVVEMLAGQLYLVTVIGVVVGSFGRRSARP